MTAITFGIINRATITGFVTWLLDTKHLSAATANQRLTAIKSFLSYCAGEDPTLVAIWSEVKQVRPARAAVHPPDGLTMPAVDALIRTPV